MTFDGTNYTLSTGRRFYAHSGILGLSPESGRLTEGYDGIGEVYWDHSDDNEPPPLTPEERHEIAAFMVALWQRWPDAL